MAASAYQIALTRPGSMLYALFARGPRWPLYFLDTRQTDEMLTLNAILKTTRQMSSYGESGTPGAMDHLPDRVQGQPKGKDVDVSLDSEDGEESSARRWDDELQVYRFD